MISKDNSTGLSGRAMSRRAFVRGMPLVGVSMAVPAFAAPSLSADERIEAAIAEIVSAMAEKYATWRAPQVTHQETAAFDDGKLVRVARHAVLIFASEERFGAEEGRYWVRDAQ